MASKVCTPPWFPIVALVLLTLSPPIVSSSRILLQAGPPPPSSTTAAPSSSESTSAPSSSESTPTPSASASTPSPSSSESTPAPGSSESTPAPGSSESTPAPTSSESAPAPTSSESAPTPSASVNSPPPSSSNNPPAPSPTNTPSPNAPSPSSFNAPSPFQSSPAAAPSPTSGSAPNPSGSSSSAPSPGQATPVATAFVQAPAPALLAPAPAPILVPAPTPGSTPSPICSPNANATAALQPIVNPTPLGTDNITLNITGVPGVGYTFLVSNLSVNVLLGGPNVSRGLIFLPDAGVDPAAYAPYARATSLLGIFVVIAADRSYGTILTAMALQPDYQYWALGGHGQGGTVAAGLVKVLTPKVKGLVLLGAALPASVDLSSTNVLVTSAYGLQDTIVSPQQVLNDTARLPGDAWVVPFNLSHYDLIYSQCTGNDPASTSGSKLTDTSSTTLTTLFIFPIRLAQWAAATPHALSFGDNTVLTPGLNTSKPYPVDSTGPVSFQTILIPGTVPQRHWYVFSPPANGTTGGYIFLPGAAVDARAYFPVAFQIAARGWLVTIVEVTARLATLNLTDSTAVINSTNPAFASVNKTKWAVGGHSAGGQGAAAYVAVNPTKVFALVMLSGSVGPSFNLSSNPVPVVNIIGNLDRLGGPTSEYSIASQTAYFGAYSNPNVTAPTVVITGGNHYQMGDYGYQYYDNVALIGQDEQQSTAAVDVVAALNRLVPK